jgi:tetratricopeptide (TPR) repeat protein
MKAIWRIACAGIVCAGVLAHAGQKPAYADTWAEALEKYRSGSFSDARRLLLSSLDAAQSEHDRDAEAKILFDLSKVDESIGDYEAAEGNLRRLLAMLDSKDDLYSVVLQQLAANLERSGQLDEALRVRSELIDIAAERRSESPVEAWMMLQKASTYQKSGKFLEAERLYLRGFAMLDDIVGHDAIILYDDDLIELADLYEQQGRYAEAAALHARNCDALENSDRDDNMREERLPMALHSYARVLRLAGRVHEAEEVEARLSGLDGAEPRRE